tara:strand:- start:570 stop:1028 length:459 start_codon:yes stop_codon:yes gene_type:complete
MKRLWIILFVISSIWAQVYQGQIDGTFEGWEGKTVVTLTNYERWQQDEYYNKYYYAYKPKVTIVKDGVIYKMKVDGLSKAVRVKKLSVTAIPKVPQSQQYEPLEGAFQDKRTDKGKMTQFITELKKTKSGRTILYILLSGMIYLIYVFITGT